jgi:hypothetical protein
VQIERAATLEGVAALFCGWLAAEVSPGVLS